MCRELGIFYFIFIVERVRKLIMKGTTVFFFNLFYSACLRIAYFR